MGGVSRARSGKPRGDGSTRDDGTHRGDGASGARGDARERGNDPGRMKDAGDDDGGRAVTRRGGTEGKTAKQARRASSFAPNVGARGKSRLRGAKARDDDARESPSASGGEDGGGRGSDGSGRSTPERPSSRLGRVVAESARKKSRLGAAGASAAGSRLRTARESGTPVGRKAPTAMGDGVATPTSAVLRRVSAPVGARSPAPSRTSKQMVPALARLESKLASPSPTPTPASPLALATGGAVEPASASPGSLPIVAVPPPMAIPAHRWVRSAGSTRGGRVGEGSRRDALEASTSYADDPAMTIRDIIRQKSAEERVKEAKTRVLNKANKRPMPDFGKKKAAAAALAAPAPLAPAPAPAKPTVMAPQVQVIDGNIVINPQSLTVNAAAEKDTGLAEFKRVEENGTRLNSATYSNRAKAEKWNKEDTELFYRAMTQFGTDFSLIARLFPGRTRRQVKRKYLIEDRADPRRVEAAIQNREQDPAMYKNLISVLKAQAAERMESSIDARVVLDGDNGASNPAAEDVPDPASEDDAEKATMEEEPARTTRGKKRATRGARSAAAAKPEAPRARKSRRTAKK